MNIKKTDYIPSDVEGRWAKLWVQEKMYKAHGSGDLKSYILIEFPYPSGERLHVGHARSYSCLDAVARKRRMQGNNVLFPFGWDAFGLPAENYAIKTGIHPAITTAQNIDNSRRQAISWGLSFDWDREINTTDPAYYRWTQWIFVQFFKHGLAYKDEIAVNWCPKDKTNLANEEVINSCCERCGTETERRMKSQWILRITKFADRLLSDLDTVNYRNDIKQQQINWIGRKEGINIKYEIVNSKSTIEVFTTTPVNFGATFLVISPEHELVSQLVSGGFDVELDARKIEEIKGYVLDAKNKSERDRLVEQGDKSGVDAGIRVVNHVTGEEIPVWISDFVLSSFGTGAIQGCPGHDLRDFQFARKFGLPIKRVVVGESGDTGEIDSEDKIVEAGASGKMINSDFLDGLDFAKAMDETMDYFEGKGWGKRAVTFHLRDWVFSRQHYWGEPIPMIDCQKCGWQTESEENLPVKLPVVEKFQPSETGESPLAQVEDWVNTACPKCGGIARRETDTMPNWAGSSWYYLAYLVASKLDNFQLSQKIQDGGKPEENLRFMDVFSANRSELDYWLPVDWYNGGMEHTTLHLLYSRFWHKFLFDLGVVPTSEPYAKRTSHGAVLGPDGKRMSKSRGNVINPDDIVVKYGADTLRMYEMFIGPFDQVVVWNDRALVGVYRFLQRVWELSLKTLDKGNANSGVEIKSRLAKLIGKIDQDLEKMKFNTAVASAMEFINYWEEHEEEAGTDVVSGFVRAMAPMAPFMMEEIWHRMAQTGETRSVHLQSWPVFGEISRDKEIVEIVAQVNGRLRDKLPIPRAELSEENVKQLAIASAKVSSWINGRKIIKVVWVADKLINLVVEDN